MFCENCNGQGYFIREKLKEVIVLDICKECIGAGQDDWIEEIVGRRPENAYLKRLLNIKKILKKNKYKKYRFPSPSHIYHFPKDSKWGEAVSSELF